YNDERRAAVTAEMTEALARAEDGRWPNPQERVWVFTSEIPDGTWGAQGSIFRLPDIAGYVAGDAGRRYAERQLAGRPRETAQARGQLVEHVAQVLDVQRMPLAPPPVTDHAARQHDHVARVLLPVDEDAPEAVALEPGHGGLRIPVWRPFTLLSASQ